MKHLTISLLIVALCFTCFFSCGGNSTNATAEGNDTEELISGRKNPKNNLSKQEMLDKMNEANTKKTAINENDKAVAEKKSVEGQRLGQDQAEQSSRDQVRRYQKVKGLPPTNEQKKIANRICSCLNKNPLFESVKKSKSSNEIVKNIGENKEKEVKALQDCYNKIMVPSIQKLDQDAGIFAMKTRTHLNKKCLDGTDEFWINIGTYLGRKSKPAEIEIDMLKMEAEKKALFKQN